MGGNKDGGGDASKRGGNPCNHWGKAANGEWQPVGDSNPCDGTENPVTNAQKPNENGGVGDDTTLNPTLDDAKTSQMDAIRAALAGLSRDELISLLADALAGKA